MVPVKFISNLPIGFGGGTDYGRQVMTKAHMTCDQLSKTKLVRPEGRKFIHGWVTNYQSENILLIEKVYKMLVFFWSWLKMPCALLPSLGARPQFTVSYL